MPWQFPAKQAFGRQVLSPLPLSGGADRGDLQSVFVAHRVTALYQRVNWPKDSLWAVGRQCAGVKERGERCIPASRRCERALLTATKSSTNPGRKSGCWSTGLKGRKNRGSTGCPRSLRMSLWRTWCIWRRSVGALTATTRR